MDLNLNLLSVSAHGHEKHLPAGTTVIYPDNEWRKGGIPLDQPPYKFKKRSINRLETLWTMMLLEHAFKC